MEIPPHLMEAIKDGLLKQLGWGPTFKKALETLNKKLGPLKMEDGEVRIGRMDRALPSELPHAIIVKKNDYDEFAEKYFAHWEMHYQLQPEEDLTEHVYWSSQWRFKLYRVTDTLSQVEVPCVCCNKVVAQAHSMDRGEFAMIMRVAAAVQGPTLQHAFTLNETPDCVYVFSHIHLHICKKCHEPVCCDLVCIMAHHRKCELVPAMEELVAAVYDRDVDHEKEVRWIQQFGENVE